ncbi:ankyrin repeat and LEM domain-containing protein 1-like [Pollicipes pollicipes]|uniref:ankyrin repeat and LEM domain-containing protein 1-like n=1 Tax=Pollicipes pollicipes TaxID=41117 RepID=UPI00188505E9|nr:ankyrin repeat and LEM domain-containing protein 1-like [Pollicipes pollicipes]
MFFQSGCENGDIDSVVSETEEEPFSLLENISQLTLSSDGVLDEVWLADSCLSYADRSSVTSASDTDLSPDGTLAARSGDSEEEPTAGGDTAPRCHGLNNLSTVYERSGDATGDGSLNATCEPDVASMASDCQSRWSDFVSSDEEYFTADGGSSAPPAAELARRLRELGYSPGPVTADTVSLYRRRLAQLEEHAARFTPQLDACLRAAPAQLGRLAALEESAAARRSCFNYLLLDPRVTARGGSGGPLPFATFVGAVFYVGKGQQRRPYSHLVEATGAPGAAACAKVEHIRAIWRAGFGVVLLCVFQHRLSAEALTREAAMIDAIGLANLTNVRRGDYYGPPKGWTSAERRQLGAGLLHKAWRIYLVEGETQLKPEDIGK